MDTMSEEHAVTALQVAVGLPPEYQDSHAMVMRIIRTIFEEDDYDINLEIITANKLSVVVYVPMKTNPSYETAWLKKDNIASALIMQRLLMSLQ
jgi:hypothetical protein